MSPRRLIRDESGFTVIEALVAAIVVAIGILGTATVISSADTTTLDSELQQVATDQGERALEQMRSLSYSELGHTGTPVLPSGESGLSGYNYKSPDAPSSEQLVIAANTETGDTKYSSDCRTEDAGAGSATSCFKVTPALQDKTFTVTQGGQTVSGHIYTFVTWHDEECELLPIGSLKSAAEHALNVCRQPPDAARQRPQQQHLRAQRPAQRGTPVQVRRTSRTRWFSPAGNSPTPVKLQQLLTATQISSTR